MDQPQHLRNELRSGDEYEEGEDSEFFEAICEMELQPTNFQSSLEDAKIAISYFFNNKFDDARNLLKPHAKYSIYHSIGNSVFLFLEAILTFEQQYIVIASEELKKCLILCQRHKRKSTIAQTIGNKLKRCNYNQLTDLECHSELCYAEALLLKALLSFIEDETLASLIRGSMKIRQCYNSYKECAQILEQRQWETEESKYHFESGVRMGMGTFNLMISLLPSKIIKILEFIGFSGNKVSGLNDLFIGYKISGLRQVLCALTLLFYHLIVCYVLSHQHGDLQLCNEILEDQLKLYSNGVWFLFFKGRLEFMKGNLEEALIWYKKSVDSQSVWTQFHHLSYWELLWVNCLKLNWCEAQLYVSHLLENSKWSRTIYSYQKASILLMMDNISPLQCRTINELMRDAPTYKQRLAGKSLPMEKFICKKAARYFFENHSLCLPAIELMYLWNIFKVMGQNYNLADGVYQLVDKQLKLLKAKKVQEPFDIDNIALCLLLRGACLRLMEKHFLALKDLEECINLQSKLKEDHYIIPYANVEMALVYADEHRYAVAIAILEKTKKNYTGYSLESRLHFRIHANLMEFKEKQQ